MRRLYLLRHAKSSWDDAGLPDHERPLALRGRDACARVAAHLEGAGISPVVVVCSSARRARETLAAVLPALGPDLQVRVDRRLYTFDGDALLATVRALPDDATTVMLVGHNPAIEDLAATLAREGERLPSLREKFPTGALAEIALDVDTWRDVAPSCGVLTSFVVPRELPAAFTR